MKGLKQILLCLCSAGVLSTLLIVHQEKKEFSIDTISSPISFHAEWETRPLSTQEAQDIEIALTQPYYYLGSGGQCIAFVSLDQQYVIKFFKQKKLSPPHWLNHFPLSFLLYPLKQKKMFKTQEKQRHVYQAFKLSFDHLADETGLLFIHLNPTHHLNTSLVFTDKKGNQHHLSLDQFAFAIQKKAVLTYNALNDWVSAQNIQAAKQGIDALLALNIQLYKKGFRNRDPNFRSNFGFIEQKPMLIDVGRVVYSEEVKNPTSYKKELMQVVPRFRAHLALRFPELLDHFDQSLAKILQCEE